MQNWPMMGRKASVIVTWEWMGAGYLDGRDSRKTATRDIVEKESADHDDHLSLVESSRTMNIFKGRMRAEQIFFPKSSCHAGLNGQNSNFRSLETDQRHWSNQEVFIHSKITDLQEGKGGFCSVPTGHSHPPPPGSASTVVLQGLGKPWKPAVSLEERPCLIWIGMWKDPMPSGSVNNGSHLGGKCTGKAS